MDKNPFGIVDQAKMSRIVGEMFEDLNKGAYY
jgi:hypothetical protein